MNLSASESAEKSPYLQLLIVTSLALAGMLLSGLITIILFFSTYGLQALTMLQTIDSSASGGFLALLKISQAFTTICLFLVPALFLARTEHRSLQNFYQFRQTDIPTTSLVLLLMIVSMPFFEWTTVFNREMVLPEWLQGVQRWMKVKEDAAMEMTILFLKVNHWSDYLVNLLVIALLPAICEEFLFRGAVQRCFARLYRNPHLAIWLSAFIFSAIHLQFFGFLPRLLLGALFGYIYWWTGSLWYAVLAHLLNNGYAVTMAWIMQIKNIPLDQAENSLNFKWYGYLISLLLTAVCLWILKNKRNNNGE